MIISDLGTSVCGSEMIISGPRISVSLIKTFISAVEKMISEAEIIISATDTVFLEADTAFSVSEKTVGQDRVAVGTAVARRPPHRPGLAALPHPVPTSQECGHPLRMQNTVEKENVKNVDTHQR
jgi:hypothetical protein